MTRARERASGPRSTFRSRSPVLSAPGSGGLMQNVQVKNCRRPRRDFGCTCESLLRDESSAVARRDLIIIRNGLQPRLLFFIFVSSACDCSSSSRACDMRQLPQEKVIFRCFKNTTKMKCAAKLII